jgi:cytochrome c oxidase subunit 1
MSPEEFAELTEKFVEDLSLEDGSVRPTRQWMSSMAAMGDEHAESEGEAHGKASSGIMSSMAAMGDELAESEGAGHGMASSGEMVSGAHAKTADAHEIAARSMAEAMPVAAGEGAEEHGHDEGKGPIDVYMMAMQFSYMPEVIRLQHGVPYRFRMMSMDVNHGASIHTGFAGHIMRRPARQVVEMTMSFTEPGEYMIYCTVYCGDGLITGARSMSVADKRLLLAFFAISILALALGVLFGTMTAAGRTGLFPMETATSYKMLGLHGVTIFFYWLYFAQAGFVLLLASVYTDTASAIAWRPVAWLGFVAMSAGMAFSESSYLGGTTLLYDGNPELLNYDPSEGQSFYFGYILLSIGLFLVATAAIATALRPKFRGTIESWSPISFAAVAWSGLLIVSAIGGVNAFLPPLLWTAGIGEAVSGYTMSWHVLFHNMHYLPLMATVVLWYVLMENVTGVKSIFGPNFSKVVFSLYMIFVPPTSLYHMFLEPDLAEVVRVVGSLLSLFIAVPTVLVFVVIVASLETHARAQGAKGLYGWMKLLPWDNPAMAAVGMATVNLALGGVFSFVLIQEKLAVLISDTFFVPGYFHFLTVGAVSLTFIAALVYVIPALTEHQLWRPGVLKRLPYVLTIGLGLFGTGGIFAGYHGVPRRIFDLRACRRALRVGHIDGCCRRGIPADGRGARHLRLCAGPNAGLSEPRSRCPARRSERRIVE